MSTNMATADDFCANCNGRIELVLRGGRLTSYRGEAGYAIPDDFAMPTCAECGATWLDTDQVDALSAILEAQREERRDRTGAVACVVREG